MNCEFLIANEELRIANGNRITLINCERRIANCELEQNNAY
jgi:hypothetical protein